MHARYYQLMKDVMHLRPQLVRANVLSRFSIWCTCAFAVIQGIIITWSDDSRFTSPTFSVINAVPGGIDTWGEALAILGAIAAVGSITRHFWVKSIGIGGISVWCALFGYGALNAALSNVNASPTAPGIYFAYAAAASILTIVDESRHNDSA